MQPPSADLPDLQPESEIGVEEVLAALAALARRAPSPVVRECLRTCHDDIAFLAGPEGAGESDAGLPGAA
jgi:hypothetical protein